MKLDTRDKQSLLAELREAGAKIKGDGREIKCPFHDDQHASGGIYQGEDGVWRFKCHAGSCGFCGDAFDVMATATNTPLATVLREHKGTSISALRATKDAPKVYQDLDAIRSMVPGEIEATYTYVNPGTQKPDLVVIRYRHDGKKSFWQISPVADGWVLKRPAGALPLYNRTALATAATVLVVEGEKCVHALRSCGLVGTTSPMGAGKASYADWTPLAGKAVVLWPDFDEAGIKHMQEVAEILSRLDPPAKTYWVDPSTLNLPPKGDVADFVVNMTTDLAAEAVLAVMDTAIAIGAAAELADLMEATIAGKRCAISWPWSCIHLLSQALLPGTITLFCGAPGGSKSFAILQALRHWYEKGVKAAVFELEEDRPYHLNRLLAQECRSNDYLDLEWIKNHAHQVRKALKDHQPLLDGIGQMIHAAPNEQVDYPQLVEWIRKRAEEGMRIIVVDPVTAITPTRDVWVADSEFMFRVKTIARQYALSILLVTHPRKGRGVLCGMDDLAGGAAFQRFSQTLLWLESLKKPKDLLVKSACGRATIRCNRLLHLLKCRNGKGTGMTVGMVWSGENLSVAEQGVVIRDDEPAASGAV